MMDFLFIIGIFLAAVVCVVGLRLTKPVPVRVPIGVTEPEPVYVVEVRRPLAITSEDVQRIFPPEPVAVTDDTIDLAPHIRAFLEAL